MKTTANAEYRARRKSLQAQCRIVQKSLRFRIGRLQHLKAAVQNKTLNDIGLNPATNSVGMPLPGGSRPLVLATGGHSEACKARPDNDRVESLWIHFAFPINLLPEYLLGLIMFDAERLGNSLLPDFKIGKRFSRDGQQGTGNFAPGNYYNKKFMGR